MADLEKLRHEVYKLERTLDDVKTAHDYLSEGFIVRFFKKGVLWLFEIVMYFILVSAIGLLVWSILDESELIHAIVDDLHADGCRATEELVMQYVLSVRVICIIVALIGFAVAMLVRKIRRKNETVKFTLDMLEGTAEQLKERIVELRNGLATEEP